MPRYTITDLRADIARYNSYYQAHSGSCYYFRHEGRNGYQASDLMKVEPDGRHSCQSNLECGSSRDCMRAMQRAHFNFHGYTYPYKSLTRNRAFEMLKLAGVDFDQDFRAQCIEYQDLLATWAKLTKYRRPRNASGSTARYFFTHLNRKFNA